MTSHLFLILFLSVVLSQPIHFIQDLAAVDPTVNLNNGRFLIYEEERSFSIEIPEGSTSENTIFEFEMSSDLRSDRTFQPCIFRVSFGSEAMQGTIAWDEEYPNENDANYQSTTIQTYPGFFDGSAQTLTFSVGSARCYLHQYQYFWTLEQWNGAAYFIDARQSSPRTNYSLASFNEISSYYEDGREVGYDYHELGYQWDGLMSVDFSDLSFSGTPVLELFINGGLDNTGDFYLYFCNASSCPDGFEDPNVEEFAAIEINYDEYEDRFVRTFIALDFPDSDSPALIWLDVDDHGDDHYIFPWFRMWDSNPNTGVYPRLVNLRELAIDDSGCPFDVDHLDNLEIVGRSMTNLVVSTEFYWCIPYEEFTASSDVPAEEKLLEFDFSTLTDDNLVLDFLFRRQAQDLSSQSCCRSEEPESGVQLLLDGNSLTDEIIYLPAEDDPALVLSLQVPITSGTFTVRVPEQKDLAFGPFQRVFQIATDLIDCNNGSTTAVFPGLCACEPDFEGDFCDQRINDCSDTSCYNGGLCIDGIEGFTCECAEGFYGKFCIEAVNYCEDVDCGNGLCVSRRTDYKCFCETGYSGDNCTTEASSGSQDSACDSEPCQNDGVCFSNEDNYVCICPAAFEGTNCEDSVDLNTENDNLAGELSKSRQDTFTALIFVALLAGILLTVGIVLVIYKVAM